MKGSRPYFFGGLVTGLVGIRLLFPSALFVVSCVLCVLVLCQQVLHVSAALRRKKPAENPPQNNTYPFVSIHLAYVSEPAQIVLHSLQHLARIDYPNYEVIVLHNNAPECDNVRAVRAYCESNPDLFKFVHKERVDGGKAGALEYARVAMAPHTELIAIVDADYQVRPEFLRECTPFFADPHVGLVQTPQDYGHVTARNKAMSLEFRSFFSGIMNDAQRAHAVTFTGTMGLLRASLFKDGRLIWNTACITEDTDLGMRINQLGYRGIYVDQSYGTGMMPLDYAALRTQRQRWGYGNAQILGAHFWHILFSRGLRLRQRLSLLTQLTAWLHAELLIAILWLLVGVVQFVSPLPPTTTYTSYEVLGLALAVTIVGRLVYFVASLRHTGVGWSDRLRAYISHAGLTVVMSASWLRCLAGLPLQFKVTNKNVDAKNDAKRGYMPEFALPAILAAALFIQSAVRTVMAWEGIVALITMFISVLGVWYMHRQFDAVEKTLPIQVPRLKKPVGSPLSTVIDEDIAPLG